MVILLRVIETRCNRMRPEIVAKLGIQRIAAGCVLSAATVCYVRDTKMSCLER